MTPEDKTPDYTNEERERLWDYVVRMHSENCLTLEQGGGFVGMLGYTSGFGRGNVTLTKSTAPIGVWDVICLPFEEVALHINDHDYETRAAAVWRLGCGH
jgi:hypothetical protein